MIVAQSIVGIILILLMSIDFLTYGIGKNKPYLIRVPIKYHNPIRYPQNNRNAYYRLNKQPINYTPHKTFHPQKSKKFKIFTFSFFDKSDI